MDDPVWDASMFSKNRERTLLSDEHFTVDGTLIEAWTGQKSCKHKDAVPPALPPDDPGHPSIDFRGERRTNAAAVYNLIRMRTLAAVA